MTTLQTFARTIPLFGMALLSVVFSSQAFGQATYLPDCNDPDANDIACLEPTPAVIADLYARGYPYYIGHAEPTTEFFSTAGASGNNMKWRFKLPATDPTPNQTGTSVANFELDVAHWVGLDLCDPNSNPFGPCVAASDSNNPATAGSAFLELQFYAPGLNCSTSQWCVNLHINTLQNKTAFQVANCEEPTTAAYVTLTGAPGGTKLLMNNGDIIEVTITDTPSGLKTFVNDLTTSTSGFMVASGANGYVHNANQSDCATTAFDFHAMYATASPGQVVPWASLQPNVAFNFEIGHFELCGNASCSILPDSDSDDTGCGPVTTSATIGGCFGSDLDHDGTSYQADWPDGTAAHPASLVLSSPTGNGVGPMGAATSASSTYNQGYPTIKFQTTEATTGPFYPFWSQIGAGVNCVFNFGNDNPGETNNFAKAAQYGTTISNPCLPTAALPPIISKTFVPNEIALGANSTLSFTIANPNTFNLTGVGFTDALPAGVVALAAVGNCNGTPVSIGPPISLVNATLPPAGCTFSVTVQGASAGVWTNVTSHVSSNEGGPGNLATATIIVVAPPSISKIFNPPSIPLGTTSNLVFTIANSNTIVPLTGVGFTDLLPAGLTATGVVGTCNGTPVLTGPPISLTGATLPPSSSCTFTVIVAGTAPGVKNNVTSNVTSTEGGTGNQAAAQILVVAPPSITKTFTPVKILPGGTSVVSLQITNPNNFVGLTGVAFTDALPGALVVANPNGLSSNCGGTATATPGTGTISLINGTISASNSCTVTVTVTAPEGIYLNSVQVTSTNGGTGNTATATLFVATPPNLSKGFGVVSMGPQNTTTLSFTLMNPNHIVTLTGLTFTDPLPTGLVVATPSVITGVCDSGTITAVAGSGSISMGNPVGASLGPGGSCTFKVNVTANGLALGLLTNTTSTVTSNEALDGAAASATIFIGDPFQIIYAANLAAGDSFFDITNAGTMGAGLNSVNLANPAATTGAICANVYAFTPDEEMVSCCSCPVTPNGLESLSANLDLKNNTLTQAPVSALVVKVLATMPVGNSCLNSAAGVGGEALANGIKSFGATIHATPAGSYGVTERPFSPATLSAGELSRLGNLCNFIVANGSGYGICNSCRLGGLGAQRQ